MGLRVASTLRRSHRHTRCGLPALCFFFAIVLWWSSAPALAQTVVTSSRAAAAPDGGARVTVTFTGGLPQYRVFGNGTNEISILLIGTTLAQNARGNIDTAGPIAGGSISGAGDSLTIALHLSSPATVRIGPGQGQALNIDVPPSFAAGASPAASAAPTTIYPGAIPGVPPGVVAPPPAPAFGSPGTIVEIVPLKYADLSEIAGILVPGATVAPNDNFQPQQAGNFGAPSSIGAGGVSGIPSFGSNAQGYSPQFAVGGGGQNSIGQRLNDNVAIDRRLNAIILTGTPQQVTSYRDLINKIDIPLGSVMLETQIAELTDSAAKDLGIDFTNGAGQVASGTLQSKTLQVGQAQLSLQAAVYAETQSGNGRLIATPRVLALDGTPASILTGDALPIITSIVVSGVNAVQQQVQYVNVGVNLQIQPRISSDGYVTAHIFSTVSSVTGYTQTYPQISQRQAQTTATVKDGDSFIIGGLLEQNEINNLAKIPGLGDLPLIGGFFRVRHSTARNTNLYIIVTPHIVTKGMDAANVTRG